MRSRRKAKARKKNGGKAYSTFHYILTSLIVQIKLPNNRELAT